MNNVSLSATVSVGSISPADVMGLTGVSFTSAVGTLAPTDQVMGLTGQQITSSVSTLSIEAYADIDTGSNTSYSNVLEGWKTGNSSGANYTTQNMPGTVKSEGIEFVSNLKLNFIL